MAYVETGLTLVCGLIGLCVFWYIWKLNNSGKRFQLPPGPTGWPLIGNVLSLDLDRLHLSLTRLVNIYGDIVCVKIFNQNVVILNSIEIINHVFVNDTVTATVSAGRHKSFVLQFLYTDFQSMIFLSAGQQQMKMRRLFIKALRMYGDGAQSKEAIIQEELTEYVLRELAKQNGHAFDPDDIIYPSLINILCLLLLGKRLEKDDPQFKTIVDASNTLTNMLSRNVEFVLSTLPFMRHVTFFKQGQLYQEAIRAKHDLLKFLVEDQKSSYTPHYCRGMMDEFISTMMKLEEGGDPQWITDATLEGLAIDTFIAGTQTTRSGLLSFILALVNYPHVVNRIQSEIDDVIGESRLPCLKDRESMPYLNAVILEIFRTAPVVPIPIPRMATQDITFRNYTIPKGTLIMTNIWNVHHDDQLFSNPNEFLPERFLDTGGKLLPIEHKLRRSVIPFNMGQRSCPGDTFATARIFLYIAIILQRFNLKRGDSCPAYEPAKFPPTFIIHPDEYRIIAIPR